MDDILQRISDILSPIEDQDWHGKWRIQKVLELCRNKHTNTKGYAPIWDGICGKCGEGGHVWCDGNGGGIITFGASTSDNIATQNRDIDADREQARDSIIRHRNHTKTSE